MIKINRIEFFIFWCIVLIQSLVWSRFLLSFSLGAIFIVALFDIPKGKDTKMTLFQWIIEYLQFWHWQRPPQYPAINRSFLALTIPFFLVLLSGFLSENLPYWLSRVQLRLPFLLLPFAFSQILFLPTATGCTISKKQFQSLLFFFLIVISVNMVLVLSNYALNFEEITKKLGQGIAMPFLKEHIIFSVMAAFACLVGMELWRSSFFIKYKWEKNVIAVLSLFIFVGLHIIAVRTGLIALYLCLILRGALFIFQSRSYIVGIVGLLVLSLIPYLSYQFLPSFQQRVHYTIWDFEQYQMGDPSAKSDSERLVSLKIGSQIFLENKILGVGFGDIEQEMKHLYEQNYPQLDPKLPHNQWVLTAMGLGIVGLVISLISFVIPLLEKQRFRNFTFFSLHVLIFVFCMTDIPFEGTFSLSFYVFFVCLFLNQDKNYDAFQNAKI